MPDDLPLLIRLPYASKIETYVEIEHSPIDFSKKEIRLLAKADGTVGWEYV